MRALAPAIPTASRKSAPPEKARNIEAPAAPPVRLRFFLLALLAWGLYSLTFPRLSAAWKLHGQAAALADYGACMAGPTGPGLLRDHQMGEFEQLLRRRLVAASPGETPFVRCAALAKTLTSSAGAEGAHRAAAATFAEYGAVEKAERSLAALAVSTGGLAELSRAAWPFGSGYALLVKPSLGAKEAPHPVAAPLAARGRGLPPGRPLYRATRIEGTSILLAAGTGANSEALQSSDGGATFRSVSRARVESIAGRCPAGANGRGFALGTGDDGGSTIVSLEAGSEARTTPLGRPNEDLVALACDELGLVAALRIDGRRESVLRQCIFAGPCAALPGPAFAGSQGAIAFPVDVARIQGTTIIALAMGNVVRVASSRDAGASWTPPTVAYDAVEQAGRAGGLPTELLAIGRRVLLYGAPGRAGETYPLLYSDDQGASWHGR
jgi:hypothetical protein